MKMARRTLRKSTSPAPKSAVTGAAAPKSAKKKVLACSGAALPVGPYSQGIQAGGFIFVAGEKGIDPKTNRIVPGGIVAETRQTLENIKAILAEAGASFDDTVAVTVHMTDLAEFHAMNQVYAEYFRNAPPGRTTVQVAALPAGAHIEITVTAVA
jgi:2-iminobutanoate/2-iminopropanoate deaminase